MKIQKNKTNQFDHFALRSTYAVIFDLSPNKFAGCAELAANAPPKIDAVGAVDDETFDASAPNEVDPKRPVLAENSIR